MTIDADRTAAVTELMNLLADGADFHEHEDVFAIAGAQRVELRDGQHVYNAGETVGGLFAVLRGVLCDKIQAPGAIFHVVRLYLPGHVFGLKFLGTGSATSTVVASSPCELWILDEVLVRAGLSTVSAAAAYGRLMRAGMDEEDHQKLLLARGDARQRMAYLLLTLAERDGSRIKAAGGLLPFTHNVIGNHLGLTPIHVGRTLKAMEDEGLISRDQRAFNILRPIELRRLALVS